MAGKKYDVLDPKAKAARQKKIAAIGGVLFVALLAFQVPRTMKMLNRKPPPAVVSAPAPAAGARSVCRRPGRRRSG